MGIGDMMAAISVVIAMTVAYPALLMLLSVVFSRTTSRVATRTESGRTLPFMVGLGIVLGVGGVSVAMVASGGPLQLVGTIVLLVLMFWATLGIAGLARLVGRRIGEMGNQKIGPLREMLVGGGVLSLSFGFPLIGWFVLLPLATVLGSGLTVMSFWGGGHSQDVVRSVEIPVQ